MIDGSFIEKLSARLDKDKITTVEIEGKHFTGQVLHQVKREAPARPDPLKVSTLLSVVTYIEDNVEDLNMKECLVHIEDPNTVSLLSRFANDEWKQRTRYITAEGPGCSFKFGVEYGQEAFIMALNRHFADTPDRGKLITLVSNIITEEAITSTDDGMHQHVVVRTGTVKVGQMEVPRLPTLRPHRYFLEVEQVQSQFLLRMRQGNDKKPLIILHEVDGGLWKLEATKLVKAFLEDKLAEITILA